MAKTDKDSGGNPLASYSCAYDADGNITSGISSQQTATMTYDTLDRLSAYNSQSPTFDLDGNMTACVLSSNTVDFSYDSGNRLTQAGNTTYAYDADDNRISSTTGGQKTQYAYENVAAKLSQLLVRTAPDGSETLYVYGIGLIGHQDATGYSLYHFDIRGSTVALTDSQGTITDRFTYGAYGELLTQIGSSDTPFRYNGRDGVLSESNGLYYMRARYYVPKLKRFINAGFKKGKIINSKTLNVYAYVIGNPIIIVDPLGQSSELSLNTQTGFIYNQNQLSSVMNYLVPHKLPDRGEPNSVGRQYDKDGNLVRERFYGPDGSPVKDKDYKHPGPHEFPHEHNWDWSKEKPRGGAEAPSDNTVSKIMGIGIIIGTGIAILAIAADDVAEIPLSAAFFEGIAMVVG